MYTETYPKTKYHVRGGGKVLVTSAAQEKALGGDWIDNKRPEPEQIPLTQGNTGDRHQGSRPVAQGNTGDRHQSPRFNR